MSGVLLHTITISFKSEAGTVQFRSPWSLVNSSAEHVSCSDRLPSPGHGDGPGGPGGFSKSSSHSGSKEGFSAGVNLLGLGTTALKNVQNKLLSYNNHCVRYGDGPWNIQTSGF